MRDRWAKKRSVGDDSSALPLVEDVEEEEEAEEEELNVEEDVDEVEELRVC